MIPVPGIPMLPLLLALSAVAADLPEPDVSVQKDGSVVGIVHLGVSPEVVKARMADPAWLAKVSGGTTTVRVEGMDGSCQLVASESPSSIMTARYQTRRCPTATGYRVSLRDSNCFKTYAASWDFTDGPSGAIGTYRLDLTTSLWIPNSVVRGQTRKALVDALGKLQAWSKNPDRAQQTP